MIPAAKDTAAANDGGSVLRNISWPRRAFTLVELLVVIAIIAVLASLLLKILAGVFTNGFFHLTGIGGSNLLYQVQASANLTTTNWQTLGTVSANSAGLIQFDDTNAANQIRRFYRLTR